ncbi:MAG: hypothetical protein ACLSAH_12500 [Bilophila wadsworthia]
MKAIVLSVFLGGLAVCVLTGASVLWALLLGLACFAGYALRQGTRRVTLPHVVVRRPQRAEYPDYLRSSVCSPPSGGPAAPSLHHPSYAAMGRSRLLHPVGLLLCCLLVSCSARRSARSAPSASFL